VAELKMLRLMQLELISRTDTFEADAARAARLGGGATADLVDRARRLQIEQRDLAELVSEMAQRNNDPDAAPAP
jgi:hypothetical protein